jgi:putative Holliday junction resolvase
MPLVSLKDLKEKLPRGKRLMGIDHSAKNWGLALATPDFKMVTPFKTIRGATFSQNIVELGKLCREYEIGGFVIGMPYNMDGTSGGRVDSVKHFAFNLMKAKDALGFDPLIAFQDERLSTYGSEQLLIDDLDMRHDRRKDVIDAQAAADILKTALDGLLPES